MSSELDLNLLRLDLKQLADVAQTLEHRIIEGLSADNREIKALPAFVEPPAPDLSGEAWVVDAGGTNVRAAYVRLGLNEDVLVSGPFGSRLPVRGEAGADSLDANGFWDLQSNLVAQCIPEAGPSAGEQPLGYCFSYPSTVHPNRDATLITWTKGVNIPGVEGHKVGMPLTQALRVKGVSPKATVVLNDTVAALLGGSKSAPNPERVIGLIAGTGTNMAAYFTPSIAPKLSGLCAGPMAVNLESGNFTPPFLTAVDDAFDATGEKVGQQRFEKAVSGYALPYLFARLVPELGFDPSEGSGPLGTYKDEGSGRAQEAAEALLHRSADLIAAGLVGVARAMGGSAPITVLAEGSLLWKSPGYVDRVRQRLDELCPQGPKFEVTRRDDVNLYGSAVAALSSAALSSKNI